MGMTATEKVLARASGKAVVKLGDIVYPDPDLFFVHDHMIAPSKAQLDELGIPARFDPQRVICPTDRTVICSTAKEVERAAATAKAMIN